jgi:hypothetical protein
MVLSPTRQHNPTKPLSSLQTTAVKHNSIATTLAETNPQEITVLMTNRLVIHELRNPELHLSDRWRKLRIGGAFGVKQ